MYAAMPPAAWGLGDEVLAEGGLAGGFGAEDFDDAAFGDAADAEGDVEAEGARWGWPRW